MPLRNIYFSGPDGTYRKLLNVEKVKKEYNWQAKTSLEDGIKKVVDFYKL